MPYALIVFYCFLWTLIPTLTLISPPLDVVEMLAWGQSFEWGYYKHPPLPAWLADSAYRMVGGHIVGVYALSQICILLTFYYVFNLAKLILQDDRRASFATFFLMGVYYYSYPTPEFNHNVIQLPLWAAFSYYGAKIYILKTNDWLCLGIAAGFAMLAKYSSVLIILSFIFVYFYGRKDEIFAKLKNPWIYVAMGAAFLIFLPHLIWLIGHDFQPFTYVADRVQENASRFSGRILNPLEFTFSQLAMVLPAFLVLAYAVRRPLVLMSEKNERSFFLNVMCFGPFILSLGLAVLGGVKLLPMWGTPYWNLLGIWVFYRLASEIDLRKYTKGLVLIVASILLIFGMYHGFGLSSRRAFPSEEIAQKIESRWNTITDKPLEILIGEEWLTGTLALSLPGRPLSFLWNDPARAPWVTHDDVKEKGGVFLWRNHEPYSVPQNVRDIETIQIGKDKVYIGYIYPGLATKAGEDF